MLKLHIFSISHSNIKITPCHKVGQRQRVTISIYFVELVPDITYQFSKQSAQRFGRRRFFKVFTIYRQSSHLGHVTWTKYINFFPLSGEQKLGTVTSFMYLGAVVLHDGSKPEILSRIAQATAALTKLKPIWRDNNISLGSKVKLMHFLVIFIFLYACESWTLITQS